MNAAGWNWLSLVAVAGCGSALPTGVVAPDAWRSVERPGFEVGFTQMDSALAPRLLDYLASARVDVETFFQEALPPPLDLRLFPSGSTLTVYWRTRWHQPEFQRACWMIGAADADEIQVLSPRVWAKEACGHDSGNSDELRVLVVHEAVHVHHRRINPAPGFVDRQTMWWFVEGVAVLASGQLSEAARRNVATAVREGYTPSSLNEVLNGPLGYPGAGSLVAYLDGRIGRPALAGLLRAATLGDVLAVLGATEQSLLAEWLTTLKGD